MNTEFKASKSEGLRGQGRIQKRLKDTLPPPLQNIVIVSLLKRVNLCP